MWDALSRLFGQLHAAVFENVVQPVLFELGLATFIEIAFTGTEWFLLGALEILVLYALLRPLEALAPVEQWDNRRAVRSDVTYTVLNRLGVIPLIVFVLLAEPLAAVDGWLRLHDWIPRQIEDWIPFLEDRPLLTFFAYVLVIDCAEYWRHRLQHTVPMWWALHAVHHSQQQLSFWSDNRNHLLDEVIAGVWLSVVVLLVGMPPGQFMLIVIAMRGLESLSHANIRLTFGHIGERLLVSPRFHRVHHAIEFAQTGRPRGVNFAVLFPFWDVLFRTADFHSPIQATGILDQREGRDYGDTFWRQHWLALKRVAACCRIKP